MEDDAHVKPRSELSFPRELGGLRRQATGRVYAEGDRIGESIPYGAEGVEATIYITSVGQAEIPDGGESEFIQGELESAMAAVREMERQGHYQTVKFFAAPPEKLGTGGDNLIWARGAFFTVRGGRPMVSFTYITALRSKVVKLRISAPDPSDKKLMEFPRALGDLISGQGLPEGRG